MATRNDLVTRIQRDIERYDADTEQDIIDEINAAIGYYQTKRFWFSDSRTVTFNTVAGRTDYPFDTEFYRLDEVTVVIGGVTTTLRRDDYDRLETSIANFQGNGQPWSYAYLNGTLRLYPNPNRAYAVRFLGHFKVPAPVDGNEADNPWMNEAFELIRCRAKLSLAMHVLDPQEGESLAARMALAERSALSALRSATYDKTGSGNIVPTEF